MDQFELESFLVLAETLHFAKASNQVGISSSALSRIIQRIEDELSCQLFYRDNRKVELSPAGKEFLEFALEEKNRWAHIKQNLQKQQGTLKGDVRIFASITASYSILPKLLKQYRENYPHVRIHLRTGDPADGPQLVREEQVDMAIAALPLLQNQGLFTRILSKTALVFVMPSTIPSYSNLADQFKQGDIEKLYPEREFWKTVPLILPERGLPRQRVDRWFRTQKITPSIQAQVSGNEGILAMVNLGLGIGLVPQLVIKESPLIQGLTMLPTPKGLEGIDIGLVVKDTRRKTPVLEAFTDFIFHQQ